MLKSLKVDEIISIIRSEKYCVDQVLSLIETVKMSEPDEIFFRLAEALRVEDEAIIRNRFAIALQDLGDRRALKYLVESIESPKTKGYRGTLIYAMSDLNPIEYIYELVNVVAEDSLEASGNALDIIEDLDGDIDEQNRIKCLQLIKQRLQTAAAERKEDLEYLMETFSHN